MSLIAKESIRDIIYLSPDQAMPGYLTQLRGVRWRWAPTTEKLKQILKSQQGEICVIIRTELLTRRIVEAFTSWAQTGQVRLSFIFIAQTIENAVYQLGLTPSKVVFLRESESGSITSTVTRLLQGLGVKSRKAERVPVQSSVILKKSSFSIQSPIGGGVQFLREGEMKDFSQGGAQLAVEMGGVAVKDFVSLMYKDQSGKWVSIESQVRWVASSMSGQQLVGVQFLAVST